MSWPVGTIYVEELKAAMRGRFAWLGVAVVLLAVGGLATVGTQDTWLDGYGIIAYGVAPLAFIPLSAGFIERARESVRRERVHGAGRARRLAGGEDARARDLCGRLLPRARTDDDRLCGPCRHSAASPRIPVVDTGPARCECRGGITRRRALHRPEHRGAGRDRDGRAPRLRGVDAAPGADGRPGQRRLTHGPRHADE